MFSGPSSRSTTDLIERLPDRLMLKGGWTAEVYPKWNLPTDVLERWTELVKHQGDIGLFVTHGWLENWWNAFGSEDTLLIVVFRKDARTTAIFPCFRRSDRKNSRDRSVLASLTNTDTSYYDFLVEPDERSEALSHFITVWSQVAPSSQLAIDHIPVRGQNFAPLVQELRQQRVPVHIASTVRSPWVDVTSDWTAFHHQLSGRLRNTLKKGRKKAESEGKLALELIEQSPDLDGVLDLIFQIEYQSWKGRDGTAIKCNPAVEAYYRRVAHWAMRDGHLLLFILRVNSIPVSFYFCLRSGHTVFGIKAGYDETFQRFSPGNLLFEEMFKYILGNPQFKVFDFLGECEPWKMEWTTNATEYGVLRAYPKGVSGWARYAREYGWKDYLKRFRTLRRIRAFVHQAKS